MSIDINIPAAKNFYRIVRGFSEHTKSWQEALYHEVTLDEQWDLTLVSTRVYGNRHEALTIMAAAGMDSVDMPLPQKKLVLPTQSQLMILKRQAGFESNPELRDNFSPIWAGD